uniref:Uncharacterized protein n=1 Tax=Arundo donax TaxID=35708 RepID=A0A0A9FG66_ARUDO
MLPVFLCNRSIPRSRHSAASPSPPPSASGQPDLELAAS